jgi:hypothetical protein
MLVSNARMGASVRKAIDRYEKVTVGKTMEKVWGKQSNRYDSSIPHSSFSTLHSAFPQVAAPAQSMLSAAPRRARKWASPG